MSTKNDPGPFDSYVNAAPDEPMFILLARDPRAPELIRFWAEKLLAQDADLDEVKEAFNVARAMDWWRATHERKDSV